MSQALENLSLSIIEEKIKERIILLARDENLAVFSEGVGLFCKLLKMCPYGLSDIAYELVTLNHPDFQGVVVCQMPNFLELMSEDREFKEKCLEALERPLDCSVYQCVAHFFPHIVKAYSHLNERLLKILKILASHQQEQVRYSISQSFYRTVKFANNYWDQLDIILTSLLKENPQILMPDLFYISEVLVVLHNLITHTKNWRLKKEILTQVQLYIPVCEGVASLFLDEIIEYVHTDVFPVRQEALETIAVLFKEMYRETEKRSLAERLISLCAKSQSAQMRSLFIDFVVKLRKYCSRRLISEYFWESLINLGEDPTLDVRLRFAKQYCEISFLINENNAEKRLRLRQIKSVLLSQQNYLIEDFIIDADEHVTQKRCEIEYGPGEQKKLEYEDALMERDRQESEEKMKQLVEQLTNRSKKTNQVKYLKRNTESHKARPVICPVRKSYSDADKYEKRRPKK